MKCISTTNSCFLTHKEITHYFNDFLLRITRKNIRCCCPRKFYTLNRLSTTSISISHFVWRACELARRRTFKVASVIKHKWHALCLFRNVLDSTNHLRLILAFYDNWFRFFYPKTWWCHNSWILLICNTKRITSNSYTLENNLSGFEQF